MYLFEPSEYVIGQLLCVHTFEYRVGVTNPRPELGQRSGTTLYQASHRGTRAHVIFKHTFWALFCFYWSETVASQEVEIREKEVMTWRKQIQVPLFTLYQMNHWGTPHPSVHVIFEHLHIFALRQ